VRDQVSASSGAHRDVLLPSGRLGLGGSSAGRLHVPPSFTLSRGPVFSGEHCRGIHPSIRPFYRLSGHYPGVHCTHLSVVDLLAVIHGLYARGSEGSLCLCRQRPDPAPDSGPGAGRLAAGSIEPLELEESNSLALRLPALAPGAFWESVASPPPAEPGWRSLDWPVGCFPDPCALADASAPLLFFSAMTYRFSCRKNVGDRSPRLALQRPVRPQASRSSPVKSGSPCGGVGNWTVYIRSEGLGWGDSWTSHNRGVERTSSVPYVVFMQGDTDGGLC
jgi:hypothetical protein